MMVTRRFFQCSTWPGVGWFRIFGVGLAWKDLTRHAPRFSERMGIRHDYIDIGKWRINLLT